MRIFASSRDCSGAADEGLRAIVERETPIVASSFARAGLSVPVPILDPSRAELFGGASPTSGPLIVIYSGHGRWADRDTGRVLSEDETSRAKPWEVRSVLCLADGPLAIDQLVARFDPSTPEVLLIVNACYSANVDTRVARTEVSVLSGSTRAIATSSAGTPIGRALARVLQQPLDADGDSYASDLEIFSPLDQPFQRLFGEPDPRLRRQAHGAMRLFRSARVTSDGPAEPREASRSSYVFGGRRHLRFDSWVDDGALRAAGETPPGRMIDVPCQEPVGQCFALAP